MWVASANREEFLGTVQGELPRTKRPREVDSLESIHDSDSNFILIWADNPESDAFPVTVLVPNQKQNDFFGWVGAFLSGIRPFTSFCRVSDLETAQHFFKSRPRRVSNRVLAGLVGAIIGEAAAYTGGARLDRPNAFKTYAATLSFATVKSFCLGTLGDRDQLPKAWSRARELTRQQSTPVGVEDVRRPLTALITALEGERSLWGGEVKGVPKDFADVFLDFVNSGRLSDRLLRVVADLYPELSDASTRMQDTREERIQYLESSLGVLKASQDRVTSSFVAGLLMSQVAPGTLDHFKIIQPLSSDLPLAFMWYGVFAGLHEKTTILNYGDGIGRRIVRELIRPEDFLERPKCDIAVAELEVLSRDVSDSDFRAGLSGQLEVEVAPCVVSQMRVVTRQPESQASGSQPSAFAAEFPEWVDDFDAVLDRMLRAQQHLHRLLGIQSKKTRRKS